MRFQRLFDLLKLFWYRVTFSRLTTIYFIFSVVHCVVQVIFQIQAFYINVQAADFLLGIVKQGNAFQPGFAVRTRDGLRYCESIPTTLSPESCQLVWSATSVDDLTPVGAIAANVSSAPSSVPISYPLPTSTSSVSSTTTSTTSSTAEESSSNLPYPTSTTQTITVVRTVTLVSASATPTPADGVKSSKPDGFAEVVAQLSQKSRRNDGTGEIRAVNTNGTTVVTVDGLGWHHEQVQLNMKCLMVLNWPYEMLSNTRRDDITFIMFQIWVLGMSVVALLNESMPHIFATLSTHVLATAWGGFQVYNTAIFARDFNTLTTQGACAPVNLLASYWKARKGAEIPSLALNALALLVSAFLSWRLIKLFGWQTFKRVGASRNINRIYKLVLSFSIAIQLSLFFTIASIGLWLDETCNGSIGSISKDLSMTRAIMIVVLLLLLPWITLGWRSVRLEQRIATALFLGLSFTFLIGWGVMFSSSAFRWTFTQWMFFGLVASASIFLTFLCFVLGVACRINFGKGLSQYLNGEDILPDNASESLPWPEKEKIEFPSVQPSIPVHAHFVALPTRAMSQSQISVSAGLAHSRQFSSSTTRSTPDETSQDQTTQVGSLGEHSGGNLSNPFESGRIPLRRPEWVIEM